MKRIIKIISINILLFILIILVLETICYFGRQILGKPDVGWLYRFESTILEEHPCIIMKTHPVLGHVSDHQNKCDIKGGYAIDSFVFYGDKNMNENLPAIITLGGSTTSGFYQHYANGDTYPYLLSELVKKDGYQVINGGHGGYKSSEELLKLTTEVRALKFKTPIIISLNGINDMGIRSHENPFLHGRVEMMLKKQLWIDQGFLPKFLPSTWSLIRKFSPTAIDEEEIINSSSIYFKPETYSVWEQNIKAMHAISNSMGAKYFTFLQPTMMLEGIQSKLPENKYSNDYDMVMKFKENYNWSEGYQSNYVDLLNANYAEMKSICKELDFCFDISNIAPPSGNNYSNPRHHNSNGNKLIADEIYKIIFKDLKLNDK